jgi:hypothetical protein
MPPWGKGPVQNKIRQDPNYIPSEFPLLDKFTFCTVQVEEPDNPEGEELALRADDGGSENAVGAVPTDDAEEHDLNVMGRAQALKGRAKAAAAGFDPKALLNVVDMEINEMMQVGAVVSGIIVLALVAISLSRRKNKKKHKR